MADLIQYNYTISYHTVPYGKVQYSTVTLLLFLSFYGIHILPASLTYTTLDTLLSFHLFTHSNILRLANSIPGVAIECVIEIKFNFDRVLAIGFSSHFDFEIGTDYTG